MEALRKAPDLWICSNLMLGFLDFFEFLVPKKYKKKSKFGPWALGPGPGPGNWELGTGKGPTVAPAGCSDLTECRLPLDLHVDAKEGLPAPFAELRLAQLSIHIAWASRPSNGDIPLPQESRNGSWPGTQPGAMASSIHRTVGYRH